MLKKYTELLQKRRLVWERIFCATFLLCIFRYTKRSTFLISKSRLKSILTHEPLDTIWEVFSNRNKREVYFLNFSHSASSQVSLWTLFNPLFTQNVLFHRVNSLKCFCRQTPCFSNLIIIGKWFFQLIL